VRCQPRADGLIQFQASEPRPPWIKAYATEAPGTDSASQRPKPHNFDVQKRSAAGNSQRSPTTNDGSTAPNLPHGWAAGCPKNLRRSRWAGTRQQSLLLDPLNSDSQLE